MSTLILRAPGALTNPLPGTPVIPDLTRDLLLDFNADSLGLPNGANVPTWLNDGGSWGSSADLLYASTTNPKFVVGGVAAGHSSIKFTASAPNWLKTHSTNPIAPRADTPITVAMLAKFASAPTATENLFSGRTGNAGAYIYARRGVSGRISIGGGALEQLLSQTSAPVGTWFVLVCVFDGANSKIRIEQATTLGTTSSAYWDGIVVGANSAAINALGGEVAAMKAWSRALSDSEMELLRQELRTAHGLAA